MTKFSFQLTNSLEKVMPDTTQTFQKLETLYGFAGERVAFQLVYRCESDEYDKDRRTFGVELEMGQGMDYQIEQVTLVPSKYPCHGVYDKDYLKTTPGMMPDLLIPVERGAEIPGFSGQSRALYITVFLPDVDQSSMHGIKVRIHCKDQKEDVVLTTQCYISKERLPAQRLLHTEWLHGDCLADYYQVPVFGERHWEILDHFMKSAAEHGVNMILTPLFTPPLDTEIGGERTTIQLIGVQKLGESYQFDFTKLRRWIALCEKNKITNLEMSHLFTQWGAKAAPKIMCGDENGCISQLFGWETPAESKDYQQFLEQFLPQLVEELKTLGWMEHTWFHVSDEPNEEQMESFGAAARLLRRLLPESKILDALSSYAIYEKGLVEIPVVSVDHISTFLEKKVPHVWAYYCSGQTVEVPNRFMAMSGARNRILGVLLYYFHIEGFLHWGFNFYNSKNSNEHINPYQDTDAGEAFPSGDAFLVYPAPDGTAYHSLRGGALMEAMEDYRMLSCMEKRCGRAKVVSLLERLAGKELSFVSYPKEPDFFVKLRKEVMQQMEGGECVE